MSGTGDGHAARGRFRFRMLAATILLVPLATGCASDPAIEPRAARELSGSMEALTAAVADGDRVDARQALRTLTSAVGRWEEEGAIDPIHADEILRAAAEVLLDLRLLPAPPVSASPAPAPSSASPPPSGEEDKEEEGNEGEDGKPTGKGENPGEGKGEKKGHDKDD